MEVHEGLPAREAENGHSSGSSGIPRASSAARARTAFSSKTSGLSDLIPAV